MILSRVSAWLYTFDSWDYAFEFYDRYFYYLFVVALSYLPTIYLLSKWMENREPFDLRWPLFCWNLFIGIFSILGTYYTFPAFISLSRELGLTTVSCDYRTYQYGPVAFWILAFLNSKVLEFVDTIFIILRKKRLITLQWYHHIVTMLYCWYAGATALGPGLPFAAMNYLVHGIMYPYFAFATIGYRMKFVQWITWLQIAQMIAGTYITFESLKCNDPRYFTFMFGFLMYLSYFILFTKFYYDKYLKDNKIKKIH